ncbi:MAG: hypothetical protein AB7S38_16260 [Vulcanimicrobiota bacterium]
MSTINPGASVAQTAYARSASSQSAPQAGSQTDGYSGSVESLDAGAIYGNNPALSGPNANKEMTFTEVAMAAFVGVAAFYCLCGSGNNS